jgi:hypothetical protein
VGVDAVGHYDIRLEARMPQRTSESCEISTAPHSRTIHLDSALNKLLEERAFVHKGQPGDVEATLPNCGDQNRKLSLRPTHEKAGAYEEDSRRTVQLTAVIVRNNGALFSACRWSCADSDEPCSARW